jgi:hypothetical protein
VIPTHEDVVGKSGFLCFANPASIDLPLIVMLLKRMGAAEGLGRCHRKPGAANILVLCRQRLAVFKVVRPE